MIKGFELDASLVTFHECFDSWENAIKAAAKPLKEQGYLTDDYVEAMINSVHTHGPYIVIAPNIAMPHARPEDGANKVGFSVTIVKEPVKFSDDPSHHAQLLVSLSCVDSDTHLQMMQALVDVLGDPDKVDALVAAEKAEQVVDIFNTNT